MNNANEQVNQIISKLMKFAKNKVHSLKDSELAQTFNEQIAGSNFVKQARRFRDKVVLGSAIGGAVLLGGKLMQNCGGDKEKQQEQVEMSCAEHNYQLIKENEDLLVTCLANGEDFSDEVYWERSAYTQGYGNTERNGDRVKKGDRPISRTLSKEFLEMVDPNKPVMKNIKEGTFLKAQEYVQEHLDEKVYPCLERAVKVKLNRNQLLGVCVFVYNVGASAFENSTFCAKINEGKTGFDDCSKYVTMFRYQTVTNPKTKKKEKALARGLINRGYFSVLLFNGDLPPESVLDFGVKSIYDYPREKMCKNYNVPAKECLDLNLDKKAINEFIDYCVGSKKYQKKTRNILPQKLVAQLVGSEGYTQYQEQRKAYQSSKVQDNLGLNRMAKNR